MKPRDCVLDVVSPGSTIIRGKKLHTREHAEKLAKVHPGWRVRYVGPAEAPKGELSAPSALALGLAHDLEAVSNPATLEAIENELDAELKKRG